MSRSTYSGMAAKPKRSQSHVHFLGVEGGATHSVCLLADESGKIVRRIEVGPANILLLSNAQFTRLLREIKHAFADCPSPDAICLGLAGAHGEEEFARIRSCAEKVWPKIPLHPTHDLETALSSSESIKPSRKPLPPRVLVLSGTGSCFLGKTTDGKWSRFGGWGHVIGDKGSGYEIGLRALKACAFYYDRDDRWTRLGERVLRALNMNHPRDLIPWSPHASKSEIAVIAKEVFEAGRERDPIAKDILVGASSSLAKDAVSCARKLVSKGTPVQFVLAGSVLRKQPAFAKEVVREIKSRWPEASAAPLKGESAWGAVVLAAREFQRTDSVLSSKASPPRRRISNRKSRNSILSPTEKRNPKSANLDRLSVSDAIDLMLSEDKRLPAAIAKEKRGIERVIREVTKAFKSGGRLFYTGAGTSGRLGILDASECPPTFRADPEMVQGIIAGGATAVFRSVEGAEDSASAGAEAIRYRGVRKGDVLVGIAASGRSVRSRSLGTGQVSRRLFRVDLLQSGNEEGPHGRPNHYRSKHRSGDSHRLHAAQVRYGHETDPEHDHHAGHGSHRQGDGKSHGGSESVQYEAPGSGHPNCPGADRVRLRDRPRGAAQVGMGGQESGGITPRTWMIDRCVWCESKNDRTILRMGSLINLSESSCRRSGIVARFPHHADPIFVMPRASARL